MIKLKHIIHGAVVSEIDLPEGDFTIGRNHGNSLQLDDGVVSGEHAVLKLKSNQYLPDTLDVTIRDLDSTNSTYVNGASVKEQKLKHSDLIRIGTYEYRVFDDQLLDGAQTEYYVPEE